MARVFLIEPVRNHIDLSSCEHFGEIIYVFQGRDDRRPSLFDVENFGNEVLNRLDRFEFNQETDFLCIAGGIIPIVLLISSVVAIYDQAQLLLFSASEGRYVPRVVGNALWSVQ